MKRYVEQEQVEIKPHPYIYRVVHRIMEGDCKMDHGPLLIQGGGFLADKYPVTNKMYYDFVQESGYIPEDKSGYLLHWENGCYKEGQENWPVVHVSLEDARAYAAFYGKKLPNDQQWQYMAAGPENLTWPWGNQLDYTRCNVYSDSLTEVDAYPEGASCEGVMDLCGNAWEMTDECIYDGSHYFTLLRGGCYYKAPHYWHVESGAAPNFSHLKVHLLGGAMNRNATVGFRCIQEVSYDKA